MQLLIAEEVLATSALLAAMTLSVLAVCFPRRVLEGWRYLMRVATVAAVTAALLDGWPLYVQFFGPKRPVGAIQAQHPGVAASLTRRRSVLFLEPRRPRSVIP